MFINFSNHPSENWLQEQLNVAGEYGVILDIPFPSVNPHDSYAQVLETAHDYFNKIISYSPNAVLCQGEFTLAYNVINMLKAHGILVLAACSERVASEYSENGATKKVSEFKFISFRNF